MDNIDPRFLTIPDVPWLPKSPQKPHEWFEWQPLVLQHRLKVYEETNTPWSGQERARAEQIVRCERSFTYYANTFGSIYEARREDELTVDNFTMDEDAETGLYLPSEDLAGTVIPFVMYPFQIVVAKIMRDTLRQKGPMADTVFVKSRDMGMSNEMAFWFSYLWLVAKPFQARLLSRKEDLVDQSGNPDSLFWKIDLHLSTLPDYLVNHFAPGFDWKKHRLDMRLINPANGNALAGESTNTNAGRGGRATICGLDEIFHMRQLKAIWGALRASTNHRLGVGTVNTEYGMDGYNLVHGEDGWSQPNIVHLDTTLHPLHDEEWIREQESRDDPETFAREVRMDWGASGAEWVFPETHRVETVTYGWNPQKGPVVLFLDDGMDDDFAIGWAQLRNDTGRILVFDGYANAKRKPIDFFGALIRGKPVSGFEWAEWGEEELRIMEMQRQFAGYTVCGDHHIKHDEQTLGISPADRLQTEWNITVITDPYRRHHKPLRTVTQSLLPKTDFADTPGARKILRSLQRLKYRKSMIGGELSAEQNTHAHSKDSHFASAFMYLCANYDVIQIGQGDYDVKYEGESNL
jgi:hypothetical protein